MPQASVSSRRISAKQDNCVGRAKQFRESVQCKTADELRSRIEWLRIQLMQYPEHCIQIDEILALSSEAVSRALGVELYDVQLAAAQVLIEGAVAEMQTGEGKTLAAFPAVVFAALHGQGVHVATPNPYLAERDCDQLRPAFELLGFSVGLLKEGDQLPHRIAAYDADITYGTSNDFGFDYLRDQVELHRKLAQPTGTNLINSLSTGNPEATNRLTFASADNVEHAPALRMRNLFWAFVDEADNILVDDASSPLIIAESRGGIATDEPVVRHAKKIARGLQPERDFCELSNARIQLTESGRKAITDAAVDVDFSRVLRPWPTYVETAIRAEHCFHRDIHYVVADGEAKIVDSSTGRIFDDRSWQSGLHQAIEAKENLEITPERFVTARITRQRFFGLYKNLSGMTGTAVGCEKIFRQTYRLETCRIPLRCPSQRAIWPMRAFQNSDARWEAIAESAIELSLAGRAVLIGTRTIQDSQTIAAKLDGLGQTYQLLNGKQNAEEADIVSDAGQPGLITIATNLAGRGTDIKLAEKTRSQGGLHVIVSECHESARIDRQLVGRCARQGDPGSAQTFVSADDWMIRTYAPWLAKSMKSMGRNAEISIDLEPRIRKIQRRIDSGIKLAGSKPAT